MTDLKANNTRSPIDVIADADGAMWVFGYGSLMWRPEFPHTEMSPALLRGYHRALCVYSTRYRGTAARPGVVMGLDRGGACKGRAIRVAAEDARAVCDYLWDREMLGYAYQPKWLPVRTPAGNVQALAFVVDRAQTTVYTGRLTAAQIADLVACGHGVKGTALEYLENTIDQLDQLGIGEGPLHHILALARRQAAG